MSTHRPLEGITVGLSMSPPADMGRLGYPAKEFRRLVFELSSRIIRAGGRILYGGHLEPDGMTTEMFEHAVASYRDDAEGQAFLHMLPCHLFREMKFERLRMMLADFGAIAETRVVFPDGPILRITARGRPGGEGASAFSLEISEEGAGRRKLQVEDEYRAYVENLPIVSKQAALRAMREASAALTEVRIAMGGKRGDMGVPDGRDRFDGAMPGIYEEIITSMEMGKPVILLAAYGGATRDAAINLGLLDEDARTPWLGEQQDGVANGCNSLRAFDPQAIVPRAAVLLVERDDPEFLTKEIIETISEGLNSYETFAGFEPE